jgi:hypothetical protein
MKRLRRSILLTMLLLPLVAGCVTAPTSTTLTECPPPPWPGEAALDSGAALAKRDPAFGMWFTDVIRFFKKCEAFNSPPPAK